MKKLRFDVLAKKHIIVFVLISCSIHLLSCSPVKYFTYTEGGHDPLFSMGTVKTIGFTPFCSFTGCDELTEKVFFTYAQEELQERGFRVFFIPKEYLEYTGTEVHVKEDYKEMPDLTLTLWFNQGMGNVVHVPGQSGGSVNWGKWGGGGYYGETQGYDVQTYFLQIGYVLWGGKPQYTDIVWKGVLGKGSPKLDLFEQAQTMTGEIFRKLF